MKNIIQYYIVIIFIILSLVNADDYDRNWMSLLDDNLRLNEVSIPGTHDSGTHYVAFIKSIHAKTQSLNIKEQLENGIRYLDIRLSIDEDALDDIYLSHMGAVCYEDVWRDKRLYLNKVLDYCVEFLSSEKSSKETIILHFKKEQIQGGLNNSEIVDKLENILEKYKNFIYVNEYDEIKTNKIPMLKNLRGKIFIVSRDLSIGYSMSIPDMGGCYEYSNNGYLRFNDGKKCYPIVDTTNELDYRVQDNYNLEKDDKWDMVYDVLMNKIDSRSNTENFYDATVITDNSKFYDKTKTDALTINFLNSARASDDLGWISYVMDTIFDSSIKQSSKFINDNLAGFDEKDIIHQWIIMDFPTTPAIRRVYSSNNLSNKDVTVKTFGYYVDTVVNFFSSFLPFRKRDGDDTKFCLQRELAYNENGEKYYAVTSDSKCIDNSKSKWYIKKNGKYFNIISDYDKQCLVVFDNKYLGLYSCGKKNDRVNELFSIVNNKICSSTNSNLCINNDFDISPAILESEENKKFTCPFDIIKQGYKCCSSCIDIDYTDESGNWGNENGDWCGIPYECTITDLRTIPQNPKNYKYRIRNIETNKCLITYNTGSSDRIVLGDCDDTNYSGWYIKDNELISSYNKKCLYVTNGIDAAMENCEKIYNGDDRYKYFDIIDNKHICVKYNLDSRKCLNGENLRFLTLKNEYSEWKIENLDGITITSIDNTEIEIPPTSECHSKAGYPCCSSDISEIVFTDEEGNWGSENNEWCLIVDNSQDIINNTESECPYDGYPCCSSNNSKFYFSDESGIWGYKNTNWGYENGYCIINDDISKYTKVTSYDLCIFDFYGYPCCSSNVTEISMTDDSGTRWGEENGNYCGYYESKSDYKSYWFYHAESNKCLYAPENIFISDKVTLKTCDESDYSKWMTLESRTGFIYSVAYPNYCININSNDEITLGLCNNYAKISHTDSALFIPTLFEDKCIGLLNDDDINKDSISLRLNTCTNKLSDNFYVWNETDYKQNIMNLGKYNYCSSNISEIVFTDNVGNWGVENGEWCLIKDN
jgi:hypothetical protein